MEIRISVAADVPAILEFVRAMGFNARDEATWNGLSMRAAIATEAGRIVGAIPVEPRAVRVSPGESAIVLHQTAVAVLPQMRGRGVGTAMQNTLAARGAAMSVYREEPQSPAYRWYEANGFARVMRIVNHYWSPDGAEFAQPVRGGGDESAPPPALDAAAPPVTDWSPPAWAPRSALWKQSHAATCLHVDRDSRPLAGWVAVHPYRSRYQLRLSTTAGGWALLGWTTMHEPSPRVDVLDFAGDIAGALRGVIAAGVSVRWPIAATDEESVSQATELGMKPGWSFDMLWRGEEPDAQCGRYFALDYV